MAERRVINGTVYEKGDDGVIRPVGSSGGVFSLPPDPQQQASDARAAAAAAREAARFQWEQQKHAQENIATAPPGDITKTGEDYLKTLPPNLALQVKALSEGRRAFPTGAALRNPEMQALVAAATQYDPSLDAANAATRVATRKDFTSGNSSQNITSLNTVLGHLGDLWKASQELHNRGFVPWNAVANTAASATGDPAMRRYQLAQQAAVSEMERAFRQAGGSEKDILAWKDALSSSSSPAQFRASMEMAVHLLDSRLQAMGDAYQRGMGKSEDPINFLAPHAQAVYHALGPGGDGHIMDFGKPPAGGPSGTGGGGGDPTPLVPASGATRDIPDPQASAMINALINSGAPLDQINAAVTAKGFAPVAPADYAKIKTWMQQNPGKAYTGTNAHKTEDLSLLQRAAGSPTGAFLANMSDAFTGGVSTALAGDKGRGALAAMQAANPDASAIGGIVGGVTGAATGEGLLAKAAPASLARFAPRASDAMFGGLTGFNSAPEGQGLQGAATGALLGVAGGALGEKAVRGAAAVARGVSDPAVTYLRELGVPMTAGQVLASTGALGRGLKKMEDAATSIPFVGNMIEARRREGLQAFNKAAFDIGAQTTGGQVQNIGQQGIADLADLKSQAYSNALDPITIDAGHSQFMQDVNAARQRAMAIPNVNGAQDAALAGLQSRIDGAIDPNTDLMSGRGFQEAYRGLARTARERAAGDYGHEIGQTMRQGQDALASALETQKPGAYQGFVNANTANRRLNVLADAVNSAKNQEGQMFTPAQLNAADTTAASRLTGKVAAASGDRPFADLANAGQQVLPSKLPDSGTASRMMLQRLLTGSALLGTGAAGGYASGDTAGGTEMGLGLAALLAAGGTNRAQRVITSALVDRPENALRIADLLASRRAAQLAGAFGAGTAPMLLSPGN